MNVWTDEHTSLEGISYWNVINSGELTRGFERRENYNLLDFTTICTFLYVCLKSYMKFYLNLTVYSLPFHLV